jgi:hypothetical protein
MAQLLGDEQRRKCMAEDAEDPGEGLSRKAKVKKTK